MGEWSLCTRYTVCHYEPELNHKQRSMYVSALISVLDKMYEQEDGARAAASHVSSAGVDYLFVRLSLLLPVALTLTLNHNG